MHGGEIIIKPSQQATYAPEQNVIVGNTCLYGATGGSLCQRLVSALAAQPKAAVIEGAGDHCCEYTPVA